MFLSRRLALSCLLVSLTLMLGSAPCAAQGGSKVEQLLAQAKAAQQAGKLFDPAEGNAFALYLEVTQQEDAASLDPKVRRLTDSMSGSGPLQQAQYALNEMFRAGLTRVEQALSDGELVDAGRILDMLEKTQPNSPTVAQYRTNHKNALTAARAGLKSTDPMQLPPLVSSRPPVFPPRALRKGTTGWVHMGFTIQADGSVTDIKVLATEPLGVFEREAIKALSQWEFEPGSKSIRAQQRFDFTIEE
jgi:TonB family protein